MNRQHIKNFQVQHYAKADKRIKHAAWNARFLWNSPYNAPELGILNFSGRWNWL